MANFLGSHDEFVGRVQEKSKKSRFGNRNIIDYREPKKENDLWQFGIVANSWGEVLASAPPPASYGHAATAKDDTPGGTPTSTTLGS